MNNNDDEHAFHYVIYLWLLNTRPYVNWNMENHLGNIATTRHMALSWPSN
jgi:hypothetical protein